MPKNTNEEIEIIEHHMDTAKNPVMYKKYLAIRLYMKGHTNKNVAETLNLDQHTVGNYIKTYKTSGVEGLTPKKPTGRPRFLTKEQEIQLYETISRKTPDEVGFDGVKNWTAKLACLWVSREFGVEYKINGMLDMFHRLKLSYTRPTYILAKADSEKQEQFKEDFNGLKKTPERRD